VVEEGALHAVRADDLLVGSQELQTGWIQSSVGPKRAMFESQRGHHHVALP